MKTRAYNFLAWWASLETAVLVGYQILTATALRHSPGWVLSVDGMLFGSAMWFVWDAFVPRDLIERLSSVAIWCGLGPRVPMGRDDTGQLVAYDPDLHSSEDTRRMLAEIWAAPDHSWADAT